MSSDHRRVVLNKIKLLKDCWPGLGQIPVGASLHLRLVLFLAERASVKPHSLELL